MRSGQGMNLMPNVRPMPQEEDTIIMMNITRPRCPKCGELAIATLEDVPALALLDCDKDGKAEYVGETELFWDAQYTVKDHKGRITLECPNGHRWLARLEE